jgi:hypothetical protein
MQDNRDDLGDVLLFMLALAACGLIVAALALFP